MNIRKRIGNLEMAVGRSLYARQMSHAELEHVIRAAACLGDDVALSDDLLRSLAIDHQSQAKLDAAVHIFPEREVACLA